MKFYKIGNKFNNLFSTGSTHPAFTKLGKSWISIGHLRTHLHNRKIQCPDQYCRSSTTKTTYNYDDLKIVEFKTVISAEVSVDTLLSDKRLFEKPKGKRPKIEPDEYDPDFRTELNIDEDDIDDGEE